MIQRPVISPYQMGKLFICTRSHHIKRVLRFTRSFDGPYLVTGHPFKRPDMLTLKHIATGETIPHPVNIEKVFVIPDPEVHDLQASNDSVVQIQPDNPTPTPVVVSPDSDLVQVAYQFSKFLQSLPHQISHCLQVRVRAFSIFS